jgi:hypothetical protein
MFTSQCYVGSGPAQYILRPKATNLGGAFFIFKYLIFSEQLAKFIFVRRHLISTDAIFCVDLHIILLCRI